MESTDIIISPPEHEKNIFCQISQSSNLKMKYKDGIDVESFLTLVSQGQFKHAPIHELLEKCNIEFLLPPPEPRNPELEKRILKLKAEQSNLEYRAMTKHLVPPQRSDISFREDIRSATSQITAIINFVFAVLGSFFFAFKAVEYALPEPNVPAQVMMGVVTSTVVALADLYFLIRSI